MRRERIDLAEVADWHALAGAVRRAALGKRDRPEVRRFLANLPAELDRLRTEIQAETYVPGSLTSFRIRDPKPRIIHAPPFRDRVLHHALMARVGPVLDRALVADTYACRVGKGALAAVLRAQAHVRRFPWFAQIDIRGYFASIDHAVLMHRLERRIKGTGLLRLLARIIGAHETLPGKGLPIGTLTSQHFANFYLAGVDRLLQETCRVRGFVRYMDDLVWWGEDRAQVGAALACAEAAATERLRLEVKKPVRVGRSGDGLCFCGYRIRPDRLLLSRRRQRRYRESWHAWEAAYRAGQIDARTLQAGYASVHAITAHADAAAWRRAELRRHPLAGDLLEV